METIPRLVETENRQALLVKRVQMFGIFAVLVANWSNMDVPESFVRVSIRCSVLKPTRTDLVQVGLHKEQFGLISQLRECLILPQYNDNLVSFFQSHLW